MTGSVTIDVIIGLVFVYLIYSLLATLLQEIIATHLSLRAKVLEIAIIRMLNDEDEKSGVANLLHRMGSVWKLLFKRKNDRMITGSLADHFYKHPLIKYLAQDSWHSKPAYLSKSDFSKVVIDLLRGDNPQPGQDFRGSIQKSLDNEIPLNTINGNSVSVFSGQSQKDTLRFIRSLWADAQGDIERLRTALEKWFDDTGERSTGWYKQYTQLILFGIGISVSAFFNVDTLVIIKKLSTNPQLTAQLVAQADSFVKTHPTLDKQLSEAKGNDSIRLNNLKNHRDSLYLQAKGLLDKDVNNLNQVLGLGWTKIESTRTCWYQFSGWLGSGYRPRGSDGWALTLLGWLLTSLAISFGAPFWFDLLNKLMKLRSSIATTDTGKDGQSADGAKLVKPKG